MKVAILGGGMMGLTLAQRLSYHGHKMDVFERDFQVGGLATWFDFGDFIFDKYYHVILQSDSHLLGLIDEMGLSHKVCWKQVKTGFLWKGKHVSMSNYKEFLTFPVINWVDKIRLGCGILYSQYLCNPQKLTNLSATVWLGGVFGKKVYSTIWEPLLESKFGVLKEEVPAITLWSILRRYYSTNNRMGYLEKEGLKSLFDALSASIVSRGGQIFCSHPISVLKSEGKKVRIEAQGKTFLYDRVINTAPTEVLKKLYPTIESETSLKKFLGVIRLALVLKRPLSSFYVTNLIDKGLPFTGIIEVSAIADFQGKHLVMIPRYDVPQSSWFEKSDKEIESLFLKELKKFFPNLEDNICHKVVHRERIVQALWMGSAPSKIPVSSDGLVWNVNAELCGSNTLNNNAIIEAANGAAHQFQNAFLAH